eukprot:CAMPEP_0204644008 /NCGR_PEP_ID=MMETSP0718-20130828/1153_1 /ASSEMBLY_ACC=CAM_ASM_000674 /TAXON_ID=230516 /ORGANISM="Chaetoceros curvisetus" /LENGTH=191 /DNA_ID=CAMNT_0051665425 /DNA_START=188 /DNA_END=763 /DNA_ORIENTATION=+
MLATPQAANDDLIEQERRMERRFRILTSIVHKKVIAKTDNKSDITLPHEEELSHRSVQNECDEETPPDRIPYASTEGDDDDDEEKQELEHKSDIVIGASGRFSSWRNKSITGIWKSSDRSIMGMSDRDDGSSLYSPKTCAICLEPYKVGDEICWSKNEKCPHAFHLDCMTEWLMENDDCPLCRENYLEESA